jgi:hypothetical protein
VCEEEDAFALLAARVLQYYYYLTVHHSLNSALG